jgi:dynein intermediate chain 2
MSASHAPKCQRSWSMTDTTETGTLNILNIHAYRLNVIHYYFIFGINAFVIPSLARFLSLYLCIPLESKKWRNHQAYSGQRRSKSKAIMSAIHHNYNDNSVQNVVQRSSTATNTTRPESKNSQVHHGFVCWPKEVDPEEPSTIVRWKRRLERDDDYLLAVMHLSCRVESILLENERIDLLYMPLMDHVPKSSD